MLRGSAQNPDVFFQAREACSPFYAAVPDAVQAAMDELGARTGRPYRLFDYAGHPEAERVLVIMGSGAGAAGEAVAALAARGERVGLVTVRLYPPVRGRRIRRRAALDHEAPSRCSIARRSRARPASRSTRTS